MRPKGWKNPYGMYTSDGRYDDFEDGADAMLQGLIHQDNGLGANVLHVGLDAEGSVIQHNPRRKGYIVFIPEE